MAVVEDFPQAASGDLVPFLSSEVAEDGGNEPHAEPTAHEKSPEIPGFAEPCELPRRLPMEDNGLEPMTFWLPARRSPN